MAVARDSIMEREMKAFREQKNSPKLLKYPTVREVYIQDTSVKVSEVDEQFLQPGGKIILL